MAERVEAILLKILSGKRSIVTLTQTGILGHFSMAVHNVHLLCISLEVRLATIKGAAIIPFPGVMLLGSST